MSDSSYAYLGHLTTTCGSLLYKKATTILVGVANHFRIWIPSDQIALESYTESTVKNFMLARDTL